MPTHGRPPRGEARNLNVPAGPAQGTTWSPAHSQVTAPSRRADGWALSVGRRPARRAHYRAG